MNSIKHYILTFCILLSSLLFSLLGIYWNQVHYHEAESYSAKNPPLTTAMMGIHDGLLLQESDTSPQGNDSLLSEATATNITEETATTDSSLPLDISNSKTNVLPETDIAITNDLTSVPETYSFTQVTDDYFQDAVFIGDSRTVGISEYSGIENATFLCKTSLSIYDYTKPRSPANRILW